LKVGEGLESALKMSRADVIDTVRKSNLKGRGGAGFPTGAKWQLASEAGGDEKYVICNADEGEPGMFKDRYLLFEQTDLLFDGMTIAGYAIGAKRGLIYLRGEYLYMKSYLDDALQKRKEQGLLGSNILGKQGFDFDIEITMGAGAYVCGEETALIESMEGNRGEPRNRPPFPVISGFKNRPTSVNNVETFVVSAIICAKGSEWFTKFGTESSSGTKLFSVSGDCENPGIYELPLGITINELLETVGAKDTKAVQIGGASGQCIAKVCFDHKISYEDIPSGGSIIIFDSNRDMLNVAKNFVEFFVEESCGQCTPCREGNVKLLEGLKMMEEGRCSVGYMEELVKLGETIQNASKCFLGRSCPNAFLSIVKNFKDELLGRVPESV
jgi:[NiFe] hydrogenase diaphorase moiety large subunit